MAPVVTTPQNGDGRIDERIQNYAGFWQKDIAKDSKADEDTRVQNYTEVINGL